jgi:hypothetical protein
MKNLFFSNRKISLLVIFFTFLTSSIYAGDLRFIFNPHIGPIKITAKERERITSKLFYQKNLCDDYVKLSMEQVATKNERGCDLGTEFWKSKEEFYSECMNPTNPFDKERVLKELGIRDYMLDYLCFSTTGDLEANDWCYEMDSLFIHTDNKQSWIVSNIYFYGILKNVGNKGWKSMDDGDGYFKVSYGNDHTQTHFSLSPEYWKNSGDMWKVGEIPYGFSTKEGYASYIVQGLQFSHPEDTNPTNNKNPNNTTKKSMTNGYVKPIDFLGLSDVAKIPALGKIITKDGAVINHRCSEMNLTP